MSSSGPKASRWICTVTRTGIMLVIADDGGVFDVESRGRERSRPISMRNGSNSSVDPEDSVMQALAAV